MITCQDDSERLRSELDAERFDDRNLTCSGGLSATLACQIEGMGVLQVVDVY
jgi:hypothetical protein